MPSTCACSAPTWSPCACACCSAAQRPESATPSTIPGRCSHVVSSASAWPRPPPARLDASGCRCRPRTRAGIQYAHLVPGLYVESELSQHSDRASLPALEITGGEPLAGGELVGGA